MAHVGILTSATVSPVPSLLMADTINLLPSLSEEARMKNDTSTISASKTGVVSDAPSDERRKAGADSP